jgi:methyl-accepting chemotaxis protein
VQETTGIVQESLASIERGTTRSETTANQLEAIVSGAVRVAEVLEEVANASREQAGGIQEIGKGLEQVDQVTQATTAEAEESSAASEELASQAALLREVVSRFVLQNGHGSDSGSVPTAAVANGPERATGPVGSGESTGHSGRGALPATASSGTLQPHEDTVRTVSG